VIDQDRGAAAPNGARSCDAAAASDWFSMMTLADVRDIRSRSGGQRFTGATGGKGTTSV